jgi:HEPN domain-containing protein
MSQIQAGNQEPADDGDEKELERLLVEGVHLDQGREGFERRSAEPRQLANDASASTASQSGKLPGVRSAQGPDQGASGGDRPGSSPVRGDDEGEEEDSDVHGDGDIQGALGLFAEAMQDMATAVLELSLGRHFACVDYCNQVAEKAAQAVSLRRFGRRSMYNHDLRELGALVGAPAEIQDEMATLTPFHPEAFYADTPPEEADEVISAEQAQSYVQGARRILRWARGIVLG